MSLTTIKVVTQRPIILFDRPLVAYSVRYINHCDYIGSILRTGQIKEGRNHMFWHFTQERDYLVTYVKDMGLEIEAYLPDAMQPLYKIEYYADDLKFYLEEE